jgi:hypothetical protein
METCFMLSNSFPKIVPFVGSCGNNVADRTGCMAVRRMLRVPFNRPTGHQAMACLDLLQAAPTAGANLFWMATMWRGSVFMGETFPHQNSPSIVRGVRWWCNGGLDVTKWCTGFKMVERTAMPVGTALQGRMVTLHLGGKWFRRREDSHFENYSTKCSSKCICKWKELFASALNCNSLIFKAKKFLNSS